MWIETRKQLPKKDGYYLVQTVFGSTHVMIYSVEGGWNTSYKDDPMKLNPLYVVRWLYSPEPDGVPKEWEKEYFDSEKEDDMEGYAEAIVSEDAISVIREYCRKRNLQCKGCKWSIDKVTKDHSEFTTCIFANCPCDWADKEE